MHCMGPRTLKHLAGIYILRCEVEGRSPVTVSAYRWTLARFISAMEEDGAPAEAGAINREHLYGYLGRFTTYSPDTRHRYFREVRCFFNWLVDSGYLAESPFRGMKNIRVPERVVRPYTPSEISRLIEACDASDIGLRDRAMVVTLLDTGLRCSELVKLDLSDLGMSSLRIRVRFGKGSKQRVVPFASMCRESLADYLEVRGDGPGPLFLASDNHRHLLPGKHLQPNGLKQMLRRLGRKTGIKKVHAHRFRHTFATWAIENDAREIDVQYLLGHSTSDMVRRYSSTYRSEQAATRHHAFSPADRMIV